MSQPTYQELFEKYARREKIRAITALVTAVTGVIAGAGAVMALQQLREDRARYWRPGAHPHTARSGR